MAAYNPATRPEHIEALISGVDRYNPSNLTLLHEYLEDQLKGEYDWDCMAALAVLKLYQFNPTTFTYPLVLSMLAKSMHAIPTPDFNLCLSLLGEAPVSILPPRRASNAKAEGAQATDADGEGSVNGQDDAAASTSSLPTQPSAGILTEPIIVKLQVLATLLASSRYPTFWTTLRSPEFEDVRSEVLDSISSFEDGVRKVVLAGTSGSFRSIGKERLSRYLGLQASEVESFLTSSPVAEGWTLQGDVVHVPVNRDNVVVPKSAGAAGANNNTTNSTSAASSGAGATQTAGSTVTREEVSLAELGKLLQQAAPSSATVSASSQTARA